MPSSQFAIDLTDNAVVWAQAQKSGRQNKLLQVGQIEYQTRAELIEGLQRELLPLIRPRDRVIALTKGLPTYYRNLNFPFDNNRKIAATLPNEMAARMPVAIHDYELTWGRPTAADDGFQVPTLAAAKDALEAVRDRWVYLGVEITQLEVAPYAVVDVVAAEQSQCFVIHVDNEGSSVGLIEQGQMTFVRNLGPSAHLSTAELAAAIVRAVAGLQREANCQRLPAILLGSRHSEGLQHALEKLSLKTRTLSLELNGIQLGRHEQVVAAVALSNATSGGSAQLVFPGVVTRSSTHSETWKSFRPALILLGLAMVFLAGALGWSYQLKAQKRQQVKQQLHQLYRASVPGNAPIRDVPKQLRQKLSELKKRGQTLRPDIPRPLALLTAFSQTIPDTVKFTLETFEYNDQEARLEGTCDDLASLESVKTKLAALPGIKEALIADAQQPSSGGVRFRVKLSFQAKDR